MRWLRFNIVGLMGAVIQFTLLAFLGRVVSVHYLLATILSVEAAVLHNFVWHWRWTWHDRCGARGYVIAALARFNLTNGLVSIAANLLSAFLLTGVWQIDPLIASLVSTAVGSVANFFLSDRLVFGNLVGRSRPGIHSVVTPLLVRYTDRSCCLVHAGKHQCSWMRSISAFRVRAPGPCGKKPLRIGV